MHDSNPWKKFNCSVPPYVLGDDLEEIESFNEGANQDHRIDTHDLPVPFVGNPFTAEIILLQLNPGSDVPPCFEDEENHSLYVYPQLKVDMIKNNRHEKLDYPFYCLNPSYQLWGGFRYWLKTFSRFIHDKEDYKRIAKKVCCIEFFPYHSKRYKYFGKILECQKYGFYLVKEAVERGALIVVMKKGMWFDKKKGNSLKEIPELGGYKRLIWLKGISHVLSRGNMDEADFKKIQKVLES